MIDLRAAQQAVYQMISSIHPRAFVRLCKEDCALWVSDLPRHCSEMQLIRNADFHSWVDTERNLLYLDWSEETWKRQINMLPETLPLFPQNEKLHDAYALCSLLMAHPGQYSQTELPFLRKMLKTIFASPHKMAQCCNEMREETASMLRKGDKTPYSVGRLLASWLKEKEDRT